MLKNNSKDQKGFTIIEVLIVLAIAGLILLIVFLAVPALQRNSRNTQRSNDVAGIGGGLAEYVNNNNGVLPADNNTFHTGVKPNFKTGFYDSTTTTNIVYTRNAAPAAPAGPAAGVTDVVQLHTNSKCNGNASQSAGASSRSIIALYRVETGAGSGAGQLICKEL